MKAVVCLIACLLVLATSPRPSHASNGCPAPAEDMHELVYSHLQEEVTKQLPKLTEAAIRDVPRFTTRDKQDSAPSANASLATIVNSTGFSSLFSAAFDQVVGGQSSDDDGIFTLNASPFLFAVAYDQNAYYDQEIYEQQQYDLMRRIGATVSFGGRGLAFDRDGDGTKEDALTSSSFSDIVTWETRFRVFGDRDRRASENFARLEQAADRAKRDAIANAVAQLVLKPEFMKLLIPGTTCIEPSAWEAAKPFLKERLDALVAASVAANSAFLEAAEEIDRQLLVTLVLTGVERSRDFGPDTIGVGVRASWYDSRPTSTGTTAIQFPTPARHRIRTNSPLA